MNKANTSSTAAHTRRIRHVSAALAWACVFFMLVLPIAVIGYWFLADAGQLAARANLPLSAPQGPLTWGQRWAGALITLAPLTLLLTGVAHARRCLLLFASGEVFSARTVLCLRRFAGWTALSVCAAILAGVANSVVLTWGNLPGMRHLALGVGSDQLLLLFFAGLVWLMAAVIGQGQALAEENASFV